MSAAAPLLIKAYHAALRLFPARFRVEYGEEMQEVFTRACQDATSVSAWSVCKLALHEARDLPANLLREHLAEFKRGIMQPSIEPQENLIRSKLRGAIIYGISFTVVYLFFCLLDVLLNSGKPMFGESSILRGRWTYEQALACGVGTIWLGLKVSKPRAWAAGLTASVAISLLYRLEMYLPFLRNPGSIQATPLRILSAFLPEVLIGLIVGAALAWIHGGRRNWGWYELAGALAFSLGYLVLALTGSAIMSVPAIGMDPFDIGSFWYFAYELAPIIPYGLVLGACLGMAFGRKTQEIPSTISA